MMPAHWSSQFYRRVWYIIPAQRPQRLEQVYKRVGYMMPAHWPAQVYRRAGYMMPAQWSAQVSGCLFPTHWNVLVGCPRRHLPLLTFNTNLFVWMPIHDIATWWISGASTPSAPPLLHTPQQCSQYHVTAFISNVLSLALNLVTINM